MGCLWKRQRLSSNHSLLCDCTAGPRLMLDGGWEKEGAGGGVTSIRCYRGPLLRATVQPSSTYRANAGSMMALYHMVAKTNVLPLKCRQQSWCELCMYTNELCCRMLSWWLPSLLGIDPSGVKTGRKEEGDQRQQQQNSVAFYPGITPGSSRSFQRCSLKLWSLLWTLIWITSTYYFFLLDECKSLHGNGNYSQLFLLWTFWLLPLRGKPKMGYVLTANDNKAEWPLPPQDPPYSQMCFDWPNENLSGKCDTLDLTAKPVVSVGLDP